jgi:hypothetical protein
LSEIGIAFPNAPGLSTPALEVVDVDSPDTQHEIDRLVAAAENIARIPGTSIVGLSHSQLAPTETTPHPLQIFLAPADIRGLPVEVTIGELAFRVFVNTNIVLPNTPTNPNLIKEGCFSSGPVSVVTQRPNFIRELTTHRRDGEPLAAIGVKGPGVVPVQHEYDHGQGVRAADAADERMWVRRDELPDYRKLSPEKAGNWPKHCTEEQWLALSRDADYLFFPTEELREVFEAGVEEQRHTLSQ